MNLSTFWKRKAKIGIVLKSGKEIRLRCDEIKWEHQGNELVSYTITGLVGTKPSYIRIEEIAAIIRY